MHEWDIAASNPCPFCLRVERCPHALNPSEQCLEFWPLGRPQHRKLVGDDADARRWRRIALADPEVDRIVAHWRTGAQVSDDDYLYLRSLINDAPTDDIEHAHWYVLTEMLYPKAVRYTEHAVSYYQLAEPSPDMLRKVSACLRGGITVANEYMVRNDTSFAVPSHFERIVYECLQTLIRVLFQAPFLDLPTNPRSFRLGLESEWRRVLAYGNGFHGFTVFPRIHINDLVRYQLLGGGDDLVSWSISNWVIWSMTAFPSIVQTLCPDFGEEALGARLRKMYEPLVQSCTTEFAKRAKVVDGRHDAPNRSDVEAELRALLWHAIKEYDFNYGKPDAMLSRLGAVGPASSPLWRDDLDERFKQFDLPFSARQATHVGFTRYVKGKFDEHIRESYPWYDPEFGDAENSPGTIVPGDDEAAELFEEEGGKTRRKSDTGSGIPVAVERGGIQYLYIRQMALVCGLTVDQLRNWDRRGHLETMRMRDIDPGAPDTIADRRVYPYTNETLEQIKGLAERKVMLQADPQEGVLSRQEAADRLGISTRTLDNWRREGKIEAVEIEHRVFIPEDEVERLLAEQRQS